jgi:hypothetical protein
MWKLPRVRAIVARREMVRNGQVASKMEGTGGMAMSIHTMRLSLGILFLLLAAAIFGRRWLLPGFDAKFDPLRMNLGGVFAIVFGFLNLVRWYVARVARLARATPVRTPLQPDPSVVRPEPPNQELDFTKGTGGSPTTSTD